jgi:uncharacterized protein (UPF0335 family)
MNALAYVQEPDGFGGVRHVKRDVILMPQPTKGRKKKPVVPDPIRADADHSAQLLKQLIERAEGIQCEIVEAQCDLADVFNEAKAQGFDAPTMRKIMADRKKEKHVREEAEALYETYRAALGLA